MSIKVIGAIFMLFAAAAFITAGLMWTYKQGKNAEKVEQAEQVRKRINNATIADDATTRCLADPACRLSDDGYKRE